MTKDTRNTYERITDAMIAAIEANPGEWKMPWHRVRGGMIPRNAATGKEYQGMNILALWSAGFASFEWATYKQWQSLGAQVRPKEKGTLGIKWLPVEDKKVKAAGKKVQSNYMIPWGFVVFNADQVDGYEPKKQVELLDLTTRAANAEKMIDDYGIRINHGGDRAMYVPDLDMINMPPRVLFKETATSSATENYYSTKLHEVIHSTGHHSRLKRDLSGGFGSETYAFEELVAELGSAFLCAKLGITNEPRIDHAQYLKGWLSRMKSDPKAIVQAASLAQKAVNLLLPPAKEEPAVEQMKEAA